VEKGIPPSKYRVIWASLRKFQISLNFVKNAAYGLNRYLVWKLELAFEENPVNSLLDGGIYLKDHSREGMPEFKKGFRIICAEPLPIESKNFDLTNNLRHNCCIK